jgi:trk system potassium uptake protein TrkA
MAGWLDGGTFMRIIVVGCGRVGSELAYHLYRRGIKITVIDRTAAAFSRLPGDFRGRTLEGDVLSQDLLHRAGIDQADGLAAVTSSDTVNVVVGHVAQSVYHVPNLVVRNYDPHWLPLYEAFGLPFVSSSSWGAQRIEELLTAEGMRPVLAAGSGQVTLYELAIPAEWHGRALQDLVAGAGCVAVALTRAGQACLPAAETALASGDLLYVSATPQAAEALRQRLAQGQEVMRCSF